MPIWLTVFSTVVGAAAVAVKLHETFFPDPEARKRHLKVLGSWLLNVLAVGAQLWTFATVLRLPMPKDITELVVIVIRISISVSLLSGLALLFLLDRLFGKIIAVFRSQAEITRQVIDILKEHSRAIAVIANELPEGEARLRLEKIAAEDGMSLDL